MSHVAVVAKITALSGQRDQLVTALQVALDTAQGEPGTLKYILHTDAGNDDALWFYELYEESEALAAHSGSDAFKALGPVLAPYVAGRPELTMLNPVGGKGI